MSEPPRSRIRRPEVSTTGEKTPTCKLQIYTGRSCAKDKSSLSCCLTPELNGTNVNARPLPGFIIRGGPADASAIMLFRCSGSVFDSTDPWRDYRTGNRQEMVLLTSRQVSSIQSCMGDCEEKACHGLLPAWIEYESATDPSVRTYSTFVLPEETRTLRWPELPIMVPLL